MTSGIHQDHFDLYNFVFDNIYIAMAVVLILCFVVIIPLLSFSIKGARPVAETDLSDLKSLEGTLKKILEESQSIARTDMSADQKMALQKDAQEKAQVELEAIKRELRHQLDVKEKEIDALRKSSEGTGETVSSEDSKRIEEALQKAEEKIIELEARLKEYEIIEDDIADLSLYKEENARLKSELKSLRTEFSTQQEMGSATAPTEIPEPTQPIAAADVPVNNVLTMDLGVAPVTSEEKPSLEVQMDEPVEAQIEQAMTAETYEASDLVPPVEESQSSSETASSTSSLDDELLRELASADEALQKKALQDAEVSGSFSVDKINADNLLKEIEGIDTLGEADDSALDEALDTDKLVLEATDLDDKHKS